MVYFMKNQNKIYRFSTWNDLLEFTNKPRNELRGTLAKVLRELFPLWEMSGIHGAILKGWIYDSGEPTSLYIKGNQWCGRHIGNYTPADFELSEGGKL